LTRNFINLAITRSNQHWGRIRRCQPPGGSQANPPGVSTQLTDPPEVATAVAPADPQGMPTAGRVSRPAGGVGVVGGTVVSGGGELGGTVVSGGGELGGTVVSGGGELGGGVLVAAGDGAAGSDVVVTGAGAVTMGCGMAVAAGAGRAGGTVVTEDGVSTFGGVSSD
jgi:hypothetical protein